MLVAMNTCRIATVRSIPVTMLINQAGKKDPKMLTDGARPHPEAGTAARHANRCTAARDRARVALFISTDHSAE